MRHGCRCGDCVRVSVVARIEVSPGPRRHPRSRVTGPIQPLPKPFCAGPDQPQQCEQRWRNDAATTLRQRSEPCPPVLTKRGQMPGRLRLGGLDPSGTLTAAP